MNNYLTILIYLLLLLVLFSILIYIYKKYNNNNYKLKAVDKKCNSKNCPITNSQNEIFKLHVEFKPIRDKNHMLAHNTLKDDKSSSMKGPENIFIIRHGEKIKSKTALDCNGILRSTYIPKLIETFNDEGYGINYIVTAYDYASMHQQQTVNLSSWLLSIPLFMFGDQTQTINAVNEIFYNPKFNGKNILICWEHNCIQTLIKNIIKVGPKVRGIPNYVFKNSIGNSQLPYWHTNNYKSIIHFDSNLNFSLSEEDFTTCYPEDNNLIQYNKKQICP